MKIGGRVELLERQRMLRPDAMRKLKGHIKGLRAWKGRPALTHGDIRFKNVVLDEAGKIRAILDWENCTSNLAPEWELSIALHDLCMDEKQAFLEGYGLSPREFTRIAPALKVLNILNYTGAIEEAARLKKRDQLDSLRARLHGAFDLHSL
jgi:hygromycin-B 4-O-kinase